MRWLLLFALLGCKSKGTIELDFQYDATDGSCAPPVGSTYVLYAEPQRSCAECGCGSCADSEAGQVLACPGIGDGSSCSVDEIHGHPIDLTPGVWAVVLAAYDGNSDLLSTQCFDVTVDADGTQGGTDEFPMCASCQLQLLPDPTSTERVNVAW